MQSFGLDSFKDKKIDFDQLENSRIEVKEYLNQRKDVLTNSYLYTAALHGSENAQIAMGNRYTYGIGVEKDCIASVAYKKDPAYNIVTQSLIKPILSRNYHLANDIFNMDVNQSSSSNLRKKNKDLVSLLQLEASNGSTIHRANLGAM
jgi:TPR repeat protein